MRVVNRNSEGIVAVLSYTEFMALRSLLKLAKRDGINTRSISKSLEILRSLEEIVFNLKDGEERLDNR